jgi:hypothetical protein
MPDANGRPKAPGTTTTTAVNATVHRPYDTLARRGRRWARRELDELLAETCCCRSCCAPTEEVSDMDPYHDLGLDLTVPERNFAGRELLLAAWCP